MLRRSLRRVSGSAVRGEKAKYSHTLLLPKTPFSPKIPADSDRNTLIAKTSALLYQWQSARPDYLKPFVLHDGPPYANGDLHLGHALNKILKDIVNRFQLIHHDAKVHYRPGWDCHGLPIEMKAVGADAGTIGAVETRRRCRELAASMIDKQRRQFGEFAVMTDFLAPYVTMQQQYETAQLELFVKMLENGLLLRQLKPVWWGCETQTALAEAELEYNPEHRLVAIFVKFPVRRTIPQLGENAFFLIWTSTPWTIPANKAICVHRELEYTVLENAETGERLVVAEELAESTLALDERFARTGVAIMGSDLEQCTYTSPAHLNDAEFPVLHGDHVTATAGTGLVHNAPAHGMEDYLVGQKHALNIALVVDEKGHFVPGVLPAGYKELAGKYANGKASVTRILELLHAGNMLFRVNKKHVHLYPYDWRLKTPVIQRATPQWFVDVSQIKAAATEALSAVEFVPDAGRNRLLLFVKNRSEWCISRQRTWGVPLPIVYSKATGEPVIDLEVVKHTVAVLAELGTDEWFADEDNVARWVPSTLDPQAYYKGRDTMDVWFDSGTSWTTLADCTDDNVADVYLEGSDQHRGWFQLSLLNRIIASGKDKQFSAVAPYRKIITHGFTLDKQQAKMSKLKGNVISPQDVIKGAPPIPALGTDGLRLWAASSNYTLDVSVSPEVLRRVLDNVKKLRITCRYLLGNISDFSANDAVDYDHLSPLDKWALSRLWRLEQSVVEAYESHNYAKVVRELNTHMSSDLSALYFDISKDTLYTHKQDSRRRRAVQTVLVQILKTYIGLWGPIQPMLTQETWELYRAQFGGADLPFMEKWATFAAPNKVNEAVEAEFDQLWSVRDELYKQMEQLRLDGTFKNKLEAEVFLDASPALAELLAAHQEYLDDYFLVSRVTLAKTDREGHLFVAEVGPEKVNVTVVPSSSCKCPRCWKFIAEKEDELCGKCNTVTCT